MKEFNDSGPEQAAFRLGDVYEVAHRIRRLGVRHIEVSDDLQVGFYDPRICAVVRLDIEPLPSDPGWFWYLIMTTPEWFSMGALTRGRYLLCSPRPRQVVRAYQVEARRELGRLPLKRCS